VEWQSPARRHCRGRVLKNPLDWVDPGSVFRGGVEWNTTRWPCRLFQAVQRGSVPWTWMLRPSPLTGTGPVGYSRATRVCEAPQVGRRAGVATRRQHSARGAPRRHTAGTGAVARVLELPPAPGVRAPPAGPDIAAPGLAGRSSRRPKAPPRPRADAATPPCDRCHVLPKPGVGAGHPPPPPVWPHLARGEHPRMATPSDLGAGAWASTSWARAANRLGRSPVPALHGLAGQSQQLQAGARPEFQPGAPAGGDPATPAAHHPRQRAHSVRPGLGGPPPGAPRPRRCRSGHRPG